MLLISLAIRHAKVRLRHIRHIFLPVLTDVNQEQLHVSPTSPCYQFSAIRPQIDSVTSNISSTSQPSSDRKLFPVTPKSTRLNTQNEVSSFLSQQALTARLDFPPISNTACLPSLWFKINLSDSRDKRRPKAPAT